MSRTVFTTALLTILTSSSVFAQTELYIFKDERKEHMKAAKKAREEAREKAVSNDFFLRVKPLT